MKILSIRLLFALAAFLGSHASAAPQPNFIVINIDDMGYADIAPFGSKLNRTPNLDRMAKEGRKLTSFYAERGWWNKNTLFDRACRAPLLIAAPRMKGGQVCRSPVEFVDIYPTIAELCGQKPPHALAGKSLRPVLEDAARDHKEAVFTLVTRGPKNFGHSVCTKRWRFTRWSDGAMELYDHDADPQETHDVSTAPENNATIAELKARIETLPPWPKK